MDQLVFFDLETTGVVFARDRIVEIAMFDGEGRPIINTRVNPNVFIPPEATEVHGITNDDVRDAPFFSAIAGEVESAVEGSILVGYNSRTFDTPLLDAELRRVGRDGLPRDAHGMIDVPEIDLYAVWQAAEPRTLIGAAKRFAEVDLGGEAHQAGADTQVLPAVLRGMVSEFDSLALPAVDMDARTVDWGLALRQLQELSYPEWMVDRDGKFRREDDGTVVFAFGKHRGTPVASARDYLRWMLSKDFGEETKAWCRKLLEPTTP